MTEAIWLVAHTAPDGTNVAQAEFNGKHESDIRQQFKERFPEREVLTIGILGGEESLYANR